MEGVIIIVGVIFAAIFMVTQGWEEWRAIQRRRDRDHMRHVLGVKPWWGEK